jgi:hypothetical protein
VLLDVTAARVIAGAFRHSLHPLWSPDCRSALDPRTAEDAHRRQIEAEYAAAELAASRPAVQPLVSRVIERGVAGLVAGLEALSGRHWQWAAGQIREQVIMKYEKISTELGCRECLRDMLEQARRDHERLVMREALLRELDRRFLNRLLEPGALPQKPSFRPRGRGSRLMLAAADVLESLSQALDEAAERLKAASRHDVAELHTPVENREEKR